MYLSRLILDPRSRDARHDLANLYEMHRTLLCGFPAEPEPTDFRQKHGVLYRIDADARSGVPVVLVQSVTEPDWSPLAARPRYLLREPECKDIRESIDGLTTGSCLAFRLRANVTLRTCRNEDGTKGHPRRVPLRRAEECLDWLRRKAAQGHFELLPLLVNPDLPDVRVVPEQDIEAKRGKGSMKFGSVLFEGRLRIADAGEFRNTMRRGIGPAKAFGFGLLSVARG